MSVKIALVVALLATFSPFSGTAFAEGCTIDGFRATFNHFIPGYKWIVYDETTDVNQRLGRPGYYTAKASWWDARLREPSGELTFDDGGTIEIFPSVQDLQRRYDFLNAFTGTVISPGYMFPRGPVLVRVSLALTPAQAAEYETALGMCEEFSDWVRSGSPRG